MKDNWYDSSIENYVWFLNQCIQSDTEDQWRLKKVRGSDLFQFSVPLTFLKVKGTDTNDFWKSQWHWLLKKSVALTLWLGRTIYEPSSCMWNIWCIYEPYMFFIYVSGCRIYDSLYMVHVCLVFHGQVVSWLRSMSRSDMFGIHRRRVEAIVSARWRETLHRGLQWPWCARPYDWLICL